jgi:hypothetical protein
VIRHAFAVATIASATLASAVLLSVAPARAQDAGSAAADKVNLIIVYGDDTCPVPVGEEITICARKGENERYRIPEPLRGAASPQNDAWSNKVMAYETVGRTGTMSCSPVGGGGITGCTQALLDKARAERSGDPAVRFGELIAAERARRLSTIDADAAAAQLRVEQAERDYDARKRAEEEAKPRL